MNHLEIKEERFRSELDLSISVCWVFSVSSKQAWSGKNMSGIIDCLKLLK